MHLNTDLKEATKELKEIWFSKEARKELISISRWIITWKENIDEIIENQKRIISVLLSQWSYVRNFVMDSVWLSDELIWLLNKTLSEEYLDARALFDWLRNYIYTNYPTVDLIIYRFNHHKGKLDYFSWNMDLFSRIEVNVDKVSTLEWQAINIVDSEFHLDIDQNRHYWGKWVIKIVLPWWETLILSFHPKDNIWNIEESSFNIEILKIRKLFTKHALINQLQSSCRYINSEYKDRLTWLYNRNYINRLWKSNRYSVLFIDVNRFKYINDVYWHASWDQVLKDIAMLLRDSVQSKDRVCRISWDEFIILIPTDSKEELELIKSRLIENITNYRTNTCNPKICDKFWTDDKCKPRNCWKSDEIEISLTIGIWLQDGTKTFSALTKDADLDMYNQKWNEWLVWRFLSVFENWLDTDQKLETLLILLDSLNNIPEKDRKEIIQSILEHIWEEHIKNFLETTANKKS